MKLKNKGFTLIELLVVIAVIAILALLIVPNLMAVRQRARDTSAKSGVQQLKKALRIYYNDNQSYPDIGILPTGIPSVNTTAGISFTDGGTTTYMQDTPIYRVYDVSADGEKFVLHVTLENLSDSDISASQLKCASSITAASSTVIAASDYVVCED